MEVTKIEMKNNGTYNFKTIVPLVCNEYYNGLKLLGIVNSTIARTYYDIDSLHMSIKQHYSNIKTETDNLTWCLFKSGDNTIVLAKEYIDLNSVTETTSIQLNVLIKNITIDDATEILNILKTFNKEMKYEIK